MSEMVFGWRRRKVHPLLVDEPAEPFVPPEARRFARGVAAFVLTMALLCGIGILIAGLQTPLYRAHAYLDLGPHFQTDGLTPMTGLVRPQAEITREILSEMDMVTSDRLLRRLIDAEKLMQEPEFIQLVENRNRPKSLLLNPIKELFYPNKLDYTEIRDPIGLILSVLRGRIKVESMPDKPHVLRVTFISADRGRAVRLANVVVRGYLEMQQLVPRLMRIERQTDKDTRPNVIEPPFAERVINYIDRSARIDAALAELRSDIARAQTDAISALERQLESARQRIQDYRSDKGQREFRLRNELQKTVREISTIPVNELPYESLRWLKNEYTDLIRLEQQQTKALGEGHPDLKTLMGERDLTLKAIREADEKMRQFSTSRELLLRAEIEALRGNEGIVQKEIERLERDIQAAKTRRDQFLKQPLVTVAVLKMSAPELRQTSASGGLGIKVASAVASSYPVVRAGRLSVDGVDAPLIIPRTLIMREAVAETAPITSAVWLTLALFVFVGLVGGYITAGLAMRESAVPA
jgi:uncharacterized protein involved in exopolysaccharide biosynthesis